MRQAGVILADGRLAQKAKTRWTSQRVFHSSQARTDI
jgi:hypothetical protein